MTVQNVGPGAVGALKGALIIVGILLCLLAGSFIGNALMYLGLPNIVGTIAFFAFGVALAACVFFRYAVGYRYSADGVKFKVERVYGRFPRFVIEVLKREIVFVGSEEAARAKYPGVRVTRAIKRDCPIEQTALVYSIESGRGILLCQLNEEMRACLNTKK